MVEADRVIERDVPLDQPALTPEEQYIALDAELKAKFAAPAKLLTDNEQKIVAELNDAQGVSVDVKGYFKADTSLVSKEMRPSITLNEIISNI